MQSNNAPCCLPLSLRERFTGDTCTLDCDGDSSPPDDLVTAEDPEARRLEELWAGPFGDDYVDRNRELPSRRGPFWNAFFLRHPCESVLEVGCNMGGNLRWIAEDPNRRTAGVDVNPKAIQEMQASLPGVEGVISSARSLPFPSKTFDLVFTAGVLIHQPESALSEVVTEMFRCSKRYVLCLEYYSAETVEVQYRGLSGALYKRDYGGAIQSLFPSSEILEEGHLDASAGWDEITYWLFHIG